MPIERKGTPPTKKDAKQHNVLGALSAWTDTGEDDDIDKVKKEAPKEEGEPTVKQAIMRALNVESDEFNMFIGIVIILNAILIGLETDYGREHFTVFEHIFNSVFLVEMILRVAQLGPLTYFTTPWYLFDFSLVFLGTLDLWVLPLLTADGNGEGRPNLRSLSVMRALRIVRLMRVLRVIRLFRMFQQLYLIMQAFTKAFQVVLLIGVLVVILNYVCAIMLTQAVGQQASQWNDEDAVMIQAWFGSIGRSMQTLFVVMTLSGWDRIVLTLIKVYPPSVVIMAFVLYIMVTSYTMISLITGIISDSLITSQQEFKAKKLQQAQKNKDSVQMEIRKYLQEMHEDEVDEFGTVQASDIKISVSGDQELLAKLATIGIIITERGVLTLLDKISHNGDDRIRTDYFVDMLCNLYGHATGNAVADVRQETRTLQYKFAEFEKKFDRLGKKMYPTESFSPKAKPVQEKVEIVQQASGARPARSSIRQAPGAGVGQPPVKKRVSVNFNEA